MNQMTHRHPFPGEAGPEDEVLLEMWNREDRIIGALIAADVPVTYGSSYEDPGPNFRINACLMAFERQEVGLPPDPGPLLAWAQEQAMILMPMLCAKDEDGRFVPEADVAVQGVDRANGQPYVNLCFSGCKRTFFYRRLRYTRAGAISRKGA